MKKATQVGVIKTKICDFKKDYKRKKKDKHKEKII